MKNFNLAEWALKHRQFVYFGVIVAFLAGLMSYVGMGRMEFPDFTIRTMIVSVAWPGATAREVEEQVTDKIERKLQETPGLWHIKSQSTPGQAIIYIELKDAVLGPNVRPTWLEVRNLVNDIARTLPSGVVGPFFNDRFDDVFGSIYAVHGEGFSYEELRVHAETIRRSLLGIESIKKVNLVGVQPEKITIEMSTHRMAQLGIGAGVIMAAVQGQNTMMPAGMVDSASDNVYLRVSGTFRDVAAIRALSIKGGGGTFRLGDIARVTSGYADPPEPRFYFNGKPAIGIAVSMEKGGNVLTLGEALTETIAHVRRDLPLGLMVDQVANQPRVVAESIDEFVETLLLAILIVLAVCFVSLGLRSGIVVALGIPLVIFAVFVCMKFAGIDLQTISLGALIIALGLLVDDAIIVTEMFSVKLEQGWKRDEAAMFAYSGTARPRLTGALVTCAGFIPVGFSPGTAAEFVGSIFSVVTMALLISWVVAGAVTPLIGHKIVIVHKKDHDIYDTKFYKLFKGVLEWCLAHRKQVLLGTVAVFVGAISLMPLVKSEFFPGSTRPELLVNMTLPEGSSLSATEKVAKKFAGLLQGEKRIENYTYYTGQGAQRFVLTVDPGVTAPNAAVFVVVAKTFEDRKALEKKLGKMLVDEMPEVRANIRSIQMGPPDPYPVVLRVSGPEPEQVKAIAEKVKVAMAADPDITDFNADWNEKNKVMRLEIDQEKARMLGVDSKALAQALQMQISGIPFAEYRQGDRTVGIEFRAEAEGRRDLGRIRELSIPLSSGKFVPLEQVAQIRYDAEEGLVKRRDLKPTITLQGDIVAGRTGNDVTQRLYDRLQGVRDGLPAGYAIEVGGPLEQSQRAGRIMFSTMPLMLIVMVTLLMWELQSFSKMLITLLSAPLGMIGVVPALLVTGSAMGFVVQLGILALIGIIIRNSIILIDQIEQRLVAGDALYDAIVNSTVMRFRPIMLTALAAILGMVPLMFSVFWGPMAVAIAGGLFVATILTLIFLPTLYAAWYKVGKTQENKLKGYNHE